MEYLEISPEDKEKYSNIIKAIDLIFSPSAKYNAREFLIGTQKQKFYGQPIIMSIYSELISTLPLNNSDPIELATHIDLTEDNIKGFVIVWLLMNGLYPWDVADNTLKNLLIIIEWMNYFGYNDRKKVDELENQIRDFAGDETKDLDEVTRTLLEKRYNNALKICKADVFSENGRHNCSFVSDYAALLGIATEETNLMAWYGEDLYAQFIWHIKDNTKDRPPNDIEKLWASIYATWIMREVKNINEIDALSASRIGELAEITGAK